MLPNLKLSLLPDSHNIDITFRHGIDIDHCVPHHLVREGDSIGVRRTMASRYLRHLTSSEGEIATWCCVRGITVVITAEHDNGTIYSFKWNVSRAGFVHRRRRRSIHQRRATCKRRNTASRAADMVAPKLTPSTFTSIPILPLSEARNPETKPVFLDKLRHALLNVGFLYLSDTGLPEQLVEDVVRETEAFFETLPVEEKEKIEMKNQKSFLGWSRVSLDLLLCSNSMNLGGGSGNGGSVIAVASNSSQRQDFEFTALCD
jgi:hypothetical protein